MGMGPTPSLSPFRIEDVKKTQVRDGNISTIYIDDSAILQRPPFYEVGTFRDDEDVVVERFPNREDALQWHDLEVERAGGALPEIPPVTVQGGRAIEETSA